MKNKIKITCKKHNCLFEVYANDFMKRAKKIDKLESCLDFKKNCENSKKTLLKKYLVMIIFL